LCNENNDSVSVMSTWDTKSQATVTASEQSISDVNNWNDRTYRS